MKTRQTTARQTDASMSRTPGPPHEETRRSRHFAANTEPVVVKTREPPKDTPQDKIAVVTVAGSDAGTIDKRATPSGDAELCVTATVADMSEADKDFDDDDDDGTMNDDTAGVSTLLDVWEAGDAGDRDIAAVRSELMRLPPKQKKKQDSGIIEEEAVRGLRLCGRDAGTFPMCCALGLWVVASGLAFCSDALASCLDAAVDLEGDDETMGEILTSCGTLVAREAGRLEERHVAAATRFAKRALLGSHGVGAAEVLAAIFEARPSKRAFLLEDSLSIGDARVTPEGTIVGTQKKRKKASSSTVRLATVLALRFIERAATDDDNETDPSLDTSDRCARYLAKHVLDKCGESPEFRKHAAETIDDLGILVALPDLYPSADALAASLAGGLIDELKATNSQDVVAFAVDSLAAFAVHVAAGKHASPDHGDSVAVAAAQQLVLNSLARRDQKSHRRYLAARWYLQLEEDDPLREHLLAQWRETRRTARRPGTWATSLTTKELAPAVRLCFVGASELAAAEPALVAAVAAQLGRPQASLRCRATKALDRIVAADPERLMKTELRSALLTRLRDEAVSVRHAAVDLVASHAPTGFRDVLLNLLDDPGLAVRKAVVKFLRTALATADNPDFAKRALAKLLARADALDEEDTLKAAAVSTIRDAWFGDDDNSSADAATRQMVDVVSGIQDESLVAAVLASALGSPSTDDLSDDSDDDDDDEAPKKKQKKKKKGRRGGKEVAEGRARVHVASLVGWVVQQPDVGAFRVLRAFAAARPALVKNDVMTLASFVAAKEPKIVEAVVETVAVCVPALAFRETTKLANLVVPDLVKVAHDAGSKPVEAAIRCLAALKDHAIANEALLKLGSSFFGTLKARRQDDHEKRGLTARAVVVLGVLCRYYASSLDSKFLDGVYAELVGTFRRSEQGAAIRAVAATGHLVLGCPRFAARLEIDGTIRDMLLHSDDGVRAKARTTFARVLDEDTGISDDADVGAIGGAVQALVRPVVASCHEGSLEARAASVEFLGAVLRHGLMNPLEAIPCLVAEAAASTSRTTRRAARGIVDLEFKRRPNVLRSRFVQGALAALQLSTEEVALRSLADIFGNFVSPDPSSRNGTLRRLAALILEAPLVIALAVARFVALLPFTSADDVLLVVYVANRSLSVHAPTLRDTMTSSDVQRAGGFVLLSRLVTHLKAAFRISEARCSAFVPPAKHPKKTPSGSSLLARRATDLNVFTDIRLPDSDDAIRSAFLQLHRGHDDDDHLLSEDDDDEEPLKETTNKQKKKKLPSDAAPSKKKKKKARHKK